MNDHSLGRSGTRVSELSQGGWLTFGRSIQDAKTVRQIADDAGVTGASRVEQVGHNLRALEAGNKLTPDIFERADALFSPE